MKHCLILGVLLAFAPGVHATPGAGPRPQQVMDAKPVARATPQAQQSAAPRQLSVQERAELRRQLQQFNEQYRRQ